MRIDGLKTDGRSRALVTMDLPHNKIHNGVMYEIVHYDATLANSAAISIATVAAIGAEVHFTFVGGCGGDALLELLEGGTVAGGTAVTPVNMNRASAETSTVSATLDATLGGTPTTLVATFLPGGQKNQAAGASGGSRPGLEWITDSTKTYAVRLTNLAGSTKPASLVVNLYFE